MSNIEIKQGDCLELMKELPDNSIDMILCDLPYSITKAKWDNCIPLDKLWKEYRRIVKKGGHIVLFAAQPFTSILINSNLKYYKYNWYWLKNNVTNALNAKIQPMRCMEDICVFNYGTRSDSAFTYNPQGLKKLEKPINYNGRKNSELYDGVKGGGKQEYTNTPTHLLKFDTEPKRFHPTQKPQALLEYLIKTYTNEQDTVLDNCMGGGEYRNGVYYHK